MSVVASMIEIIRDEITYGITRSARISLI